MRPTDKHYFQRTGIHLIDSIAFGKQHITDYDYLRTYHANMQKSDDLQHKPLPPILNKFD